tara:strand:- start:20779 stop:21414 length:636 start_codon:yes stop_codon:yes gene_type:complete
MKLTDIILREGVEKRMINYLDDLHSNRRTISVTDFMKEFGVDKQEAIDFIHKWNVSKVDRSVMEDGHGDGYEEGNIKLMGDIILPIGKEMVLQAEEDKYNRGLLVTNNEDKSYDVAYWADKFEPYPIEVEIDGKSVAKEAKVIKLLFHPEMDEGRSLSEPSDEMEKVIDSGIRISGDMDNIKDVMYYVHNNWMGGDISAEEAMKKISKYIR